MSEFRDLEEATAAWLNEAPAPSDPTPVVETASIDPLPASGSAPSASAQAVADATAATAAAAEQTREMIAAMLGDTTVEIDPDVRIPITVAGQQQYMTLSEMRQNGMRQADYTRKTMETAELRRQYESQQRELRVAAATIEAQQKAVEQERQRLLKANEDPDEYARYIRHVELLQADPDYRQNWERGQNALVREAQDAATSAIETEEAQASIMQDIEDTAREFSTEFNGVRMEDALALYSARLQAGQADLRTSDLRKAFVDLSKERESIVSPLQTQIEQLSRQVTELTAQRQADTANASRRAAIGASRVAPVTRPTAKPNAAAPVAPSAPGRRRFQSLEEAGAAWARS